MHRKAFRLSLWFRPFFVKVSLSNSRTFNNFDRNVQTTLSYDSISLNLLKSDALSHTVISYWQTRLIALQWNCSKELRSFQNCNMFYKSLRHCKHNLFPSHFGCIFGIKDNYVITWEKNGGVSLSCKRCALNKWMVNLFKIFFSYLIGYYCYRRGRLNVHLIGSFWVNLLKELYFIDKNAWYS